MPQYFIMFGDQRKLVSLDSKNKMNLLETVKAKFELSSETGVILQSFNNEYEDWLDIDDEAAIPDGGKVKAVLRTVPFSIMDAQKSEVLNMETCGDGDKETEPVESVGSNSDLMKWPGRFSLPVSKFGPRLLSALASKEPFNSLLSKALMDILYEEMTRYTFFPTSSQYNEVIQVLLAHYPYLRQLTVGNLTLDGDHATKKWKNILADKFRNMRKRRDCLVPQVAAKKRGQKKQSSSAGPSDMMSDVRPSVSRSKNHWGVKNYLPNRPATEDTTSIKKAKEWLKMEAVKRRQDIAGVKLRMEITFSDRRRDIINMHMPISEVKADYPCLFTEDELLNEFQRLTDMDIDQKFLNGLALYGKKILDLAPEKDEKKRQLLDAMASSKIEADRKRLTGYGCLLLLPSLLKERTEDFLCSKQQMPDHVGSPLLIYDGDVLGTAEYMLLVEDQEIAQPLDLIQAVECLIASFYVFNLAYPTVLNNTMTFFQKSILNLSDEAPLPRKVVTFMCKLSK